MALSETLICNMALALVGSKRINDLETDTSEQAIACRDQYEHVRDALLRSHWWRFASARATLSEDATAPSFQWDHSFILPTDFLRARKLYDTTNPYVLEGNRLLTNDDTAELVYIRNVTDPTRFDPLFVDALVLSLAVRLAMPITDDSRLRRELAEELALTLAKVRLVDKQEQNTDQEIVTWNDARVVTPRPDLLG